MAGGRDLQAWWKDTQHITDDDAAFERLAKTTGACGTEFALGIEARCRALLSHGTAADELYRERSSGCGTPASSWKSPARKELQATGENVRKRTVDTRDDLTAQEQQIARLARDGLSTPEISARLFLSSRTVEWHLRNVFTKLGIRSRRELASALDGPDPRLILDETPGLAHNAPRHRADAAADLREPLTRSG